MDAFSQVGEQVRLLFDQHVPPAAVLASAVVLIAFGLGLSVLGAKLGRFALTVAFASGGVIAGGALSRGMGVSAPFAVLLGGILLGVVGFFLYRLWVGIVTAALLASAAGGGFGFQSIGPMLSNYEPMPPLVSEPVSEFRVPDADTQNQYLSPEFKSWLERFWQDAKSQDAFLVRKLSIAVAAASLVGFLVGLLLPRFTLIMGTSIIGAGLVTSGLVALAQQQQPELYQAGLERPQVAALAFGIFVVGSIILQTLLTRSDKPRNPSTKPQKR